MCELYGGIGIFKIKWISSNKCNCSIRKHYHSMYTRIISVLLSVLAHVLEWAINNPIRIGCEARTRQCDSSRKREGDRNLSHIKTVAIAKQQQPIEQKIGKRRDCFMLALCSAGEHTCIILHMPRDYHFVKLRLPNVHLKPILPYFFFCITFHWGQVCFIFIFNSKQFLLNSATIRQIMRHFFFHSFLIWKKKSFSLLRHSLFSRLNVSEIDYCCTRGIGKCCFVVSNLPTFILPP